MQQQHRGRLRGAIGRPRLRQQSLTSEPSGKKQPRFGPCPVCNRSFALFRLQDHVNQCLDSPSPSSTLLASSPNRTSLRNPGPAHEASPLPRSLPLSSPTVVAAAESSNPVPHSPLGNWPGTIRGPILVAEDRSLASDPSEKIEQVKADSDPWKSALGSSVLRSADEDWRQRDELLPPSEGTLEEAEGWPLVEEERGFLGAGENAGGLNLDEHKPQKDGDDLDMRDGHGRSVCKPPAGFKLYQKQVQSQARLSMLQKFSPSGPLQRKPSVSVLQPGLVLFRSWLDLETQQKLVAESQGVAQLFHRFSTPGGGKYHVYSMCWGSNFDARIRRYLSKDGPELPPWMFELSRRLARDAQCHTPVYPPDSMFSPDIGLVNFYPVKADELGVIGLGGHQDLDSCALMPVVSVSVGDSMTFFYRRLPPLSRRKLGVSIIVNEKDARFCKDGDAAHNRESTILLESGDVLVFGGQSRLVYHGTRNLQSGTRPPGLHMVPGRLNFTFRQSTSEVNQVAPQ